MYPVPLGVRKYDACRDKVGLDTSGVVKSRVRAVGVPVPPLSPNLVGSTTLNGSSTSFSTLVVLVFRDEEDTSLW